MSTSKVQTITALACTAIVAVILLLQWATLRQAGTMGSKIHHTMKAIPEWEYDVVSIPDAAWSSKAQDLGAAGWEIVEARRARGEGDAFAYECIVKRPKR